MLNIHADSPNLRQGTMEYYQRDLFGLLDEVIDIHQELSRRIVYAAFNISTGVVIVSNIDNDEITDWNLIALHEFGEFLRGGLGRWYGHVAMSTYISVHIADR